jgi:prepilin-type processing-associated H-X9-DG protein
MKLEYEKPRPRRLRFFLLALFIACGLLVALELRNGIPSRPRPHEGSPLNDCASHLRQIAFASLMYAKDHHGRWPDRFEDMFEEDVTPDVFCCPRSSDTPATGPTTQAVAANLSTGGHLSYVYLGKGLIEPVPDDVVVAYETPGHHDGLNNVLFGDGHVERLNSAEMTRLLSVVQSSSPSQPVRWPYLQPYVQPTTMPAPAK